MKKALIYILLLLSVSTFSQIMPRSTYFLESVNDTIDERLSRNELIFTGDESYFWRLTQTMYSGDTLSEFEDKVRVFPDSTGFIQLSIDSLYMDSTLYTSLDGLGLYADDSLNIRAGLGLEILNDTLKIDSSVIQRTELQDTAAAIRADMVGSSIFTNETLEGSGTELDPLGVYSATNITTFTNDVNSVEIGISISSVNLDWTINKTITSQSLNEGIGSLDPLLRTYEYTTPFTTNKTFTLTASDGINPDNRNSSVYFRNKRYWGADVNATLNDAEIQSLDQELATSRQMTKTIDCSGGQYFYIIYPEDFGAATFKVGGLDFSATTLLIRDFINASGHNESYRIYRSTTLQFGSNLNIQVL